MTDHRNWTLLYRSGAIAALLAVFVFRRNLGAELMLLGSFGLPGVPETLPQDAAGWFALLSEHPLVGLTLLEAFDLLEYALVGLIFLAVCVALWQVNRSALLMATAGGLAGIIVYFGSNQAFGLLALSQRYAEATAETQQAAYLAAGAGLLAFNNPGVLYQGTGIYVSMALVPLAGLVMSWVMLRSAVFSRATAVTGILANGILLGYFAALAFAPSLLAAPFVLSAPFRVAWYFLIALRLLRMSKEPGQQ